MYVNVSPGITWNTSYTTVKQGSENNGYGHSKETLQLLDYVFKIYKQIDCQEISEKFKTISSMLLSIDQMKRVVFTL